MRTATHFRQHVVTKRLVPQSLQQIVFPLGVEPKGGELTELEARGVWIFWFRELLLRCCYSADNGFVTMGLLAWLPLGLQCN
jgi:hypothetical protein